MWGGASAAAQADDPGRFGVGSSIGGEQAIKSFDAAGKLAIPFRYLDCWSDGLVEEGVEFGFVEDRINSVASDRVRHDVERERIPVG